MREAAEALKLTAQNLYDLTVIDEIIPEPVGGAQRNKMETITRVGSALEKTLANLEKFSTKKLIKDRREKFLHLGSQGLI